ncbi:SAF domain-containing protein [Nonomuraea sp. B10E15]|uniref:SAF domain-containing protein n=1 Tax=unclassified Nonomuraea TaxID=2593643 RepID=UPI00325F63C8
MRTSEKPAADAAAGLSGPASRKLPVPPRERKPALAALAVLLILGGALATTLLVLRSGDRVSAIRVTQQIGAGQKFTAQALEEVKIAAEGVDYVSWSQLDQVVGSFAAVTILPGTLLTNQMGAKASSELGEGKATVGLALKPGQMPAGLKEGDRVQLVHVPSRASQGESRVLAASALVFSVGDKSRTGNSGQITVVVDSSASPEIVAFASGGEIAVAELPGAR